MNYDTPWADMPSRAFGDNEMVAARKPNMSFFANLRGFLEHCAAIDVEPASLEPVIAEWQGASVDADGILGLIEEMLPAEDSGGDPISEHGIANYCAALVNGVLQQEKVGAYWPIDVAVEIPDGWRDLVAYMIEPVADGPASAETEAQNG